MPVPTIASPVADSVERNTPNMEMLNSPEAARYTPVDVSDAKFNAGAPTVPSVKEILLAPARTVLAFSKLTESQIKMTCWPAGTVATLPPELVVKVIVKLDAVPSVWLVM